MTDSLVTIAIPTYNRCQTMIRAVRSALDQDHVPLEIIILDNASTDGTQTYCEQVASSDRRVRYIRHPTNGGAAANFNSGLEHANGTYFMWLADDDWIDADYVTRCLEAFHADQELVLVAAVCGYYIDGELVMTGEEIDVSGSSVTDRVGTFYRTFGHNSAFYGLARTDALRRVTPFRDRLGEDWLIVGRLAALGRLRTIRTTRLHKSLGGLSDDLYGLGRESGLSHWQARLAFHSASFFMAADIRILVVFSVMSPFTRWRLSLLVQARFLWLVTRVQSVHLARHHTLRTVRAWFGESASDRLRTRFRTWRPRGEPVDPHF
ncbi:MAG: hypothetical protein QOE93_373 [Actinomycetota bacterium]|nr:hypothetical protein [Actinomycetota bacterium]